LSICIQNFGTTSPTEKGYAIWYIQCKESVQVRLKYNRSQEKIRFRGSTGGSTVREGIIFLSMEKEKKSPTKNRAFGTPQNNINS